MLLTDAMKCNFYECIIFRKAWKADICNKYHGLRHYDGIRASIDDPNRLNWGLYVIYEIEDFPGFVRVFHDVPPMEYKLSAKDKSANDWECRKLLLLRDCPFCGNEDITILYESEEGYPEYCANCTGCYSRSTWFDCIEDAVKRWNTRIP